MNLQGQTFGDWTVIERAEGRYRKCRCKCGAEKPVRQDHLRRGLSNACLRCASVNRTHGQTLSRTYRTWQTMKQRCLNPRNNRYYDYGGAGVAVCARWLTSFENFLADMGERPEGKSLDRINPFGNYEPANCRWATPKEQQLNRKRTRHLVHQGHVLPLAVIAEQNGMKANVLRGRIVDLGWSLDRALSVPVNPKRRFRDAPNT